MAEPTATISSTPRASQQANAIMREKNGVYSFMGDANIRRNIEYYVYVFSTYPEELRIERPTAHPSYVIPGCAKDEPYSKPLKIPDIIQYPAQIAGSSEITTRGIDGRFVAQDLLNPDNASGDWRTQRPMNAANMSNEGTNLYALGVWWTLNEKPKDDEVAAARGKMEATFNDLIDRANALHMAGDLNSIREITRQMRIAATYFSIETPWNKTHGSTKECHGCGTMNSARAVVCSKCPATFNWEKAMELGLRTIKQAVAAGVMESPEKSSQERSGKD